MTDLYLSVGLCTYNRAKLVINTLKTIKEQSLNCDKFEIIVIDNNSSDNTKEVVETFAKENDNLQIVYAKEEKQGISHARNRAYLEASGDFIVYIDDDELAKKDWLENYYTFIQDNLDTAIVAGKIEVLYPKNQTPNWNSQYIENWHGRYNFGDDPFKITQDLINKHKAYYPNNGNMAVSVEFLKGVGGFDITLGRKEKSLAGGEDTKLGKVALSMGKSILYNPYSLIEHIILPERNSIQFLQKKHFDQGATFVDVKYDERTVFKSFKMFIHKLLSIIIRSIKMLFANEENLVYLSLKNYFDMGIMHRILRGKQ